MKLKWQTSHISQSEMTEMLKFIQSRQTRNLHIFGMEIKETESGGFEIRVPKPIYPKFQRALLDWDISKFNVFKEIGGQNADNNQQGKASSL